MTREANDIKLGRFPGPVLRHKPPAAGIAPEAHGWADVGGLLSGVRRTGRRIDMDTLERTVRENNTRRYSFNDDHTKIRANQGHSIPVDAELKKETPPRRLYHGTVEQFLPALRQEGIRKMGRQHVRLSADFQTAEEVAPWDA